MYVKSDLITAIASVVSDNKSIEDDDRPRREDLRKVSDEDVHNLMKAALKRRRKNKKRYLNRGDQKYAY